MPSSNDEDTALDCRAVWVHEQEQKRALLRPYLRSPRRRAPRDCRRLAAEAAKRYSPPHCTSAQGMSTTHGQQQSKKISGPRHLTMTTALAKTKSMIAESNQVSESCAAPGLAATFNIERAELQVTWVTMMR